MLKRTKSSPPRWADLLLQWYCSKEYIEEIQGDLYEWYYRRLDRQGPILAKALYFFDVIRFFRTFRLKKMEELDSKNNPLIMLANNLKVGLRSLARHRFNTSINIAGLSIGIACSLFIYVYITDELSFDRHHENADNIFRIVLDLKSPRDVSHLSTTPTALAMTSVQELPYLRSAVRFYKQGQTILKQGDNVYEENNFYFADSTVFDVFSFKFVYGNQSEALNGPYKMVLTETKAKKYFGEENPVGKVIRVDEDQQFEITGVIEDLPAQSHIDIDILVSFKTWEVRVPGLVGRWAPHMYLTYFLLPDGFDQKILESDLKELVERNVSLTSTYSFEFLAQPLVDIHLKSNRESEIKAGGDITRLYILAVIGIFILLIAAINFINLSMAKATIKLKEVGVRKVIGATRRQLLQQFQIEYLLISVLALAIGFGLIWILLPSLNELSGKTLTYTELLNPKTIPFAAGVVVAIGLLSGAYPALVLAAFKPTQAITQGVSGKTVTALVRKGLVMIQFAASIFLMIGTGIVYNQLLFMENQDLGYQPEQIVVVPLHRHQNALQDFESFRMKLKQLSQFDHASASFLIPGRGALKLSYATEGFAENEFKPISSWFVDREFLATYGIEILTGRDFTPVGDSDITNAVIINEATVRSLNWTNEEAIGKPFTFRGNRTIVGVAKDFHFTSLKDQLEPLAIVPTPSPFSSVNILYVSFAVNANQVEESLKVAGDIWNSVIPSRPFDYFFLDEDFGQQYQAEQRFGKTFTAFAAVAIVISCLGLFALAAFTLRRKVKEIAIRKVMGARISDIVRHFSWDFLRLVLLSNIIAWPAAYYIMSDWVGGFAYQTSINWWLFALASVVGVLVAFVTVMLQSVKAANANPVHSLREN